MLMGLLRTTQPHQNLYLIPNFGSVIGQERYSSLEGASARLGRRTLGMGLEETASRRCGTRTRPDVPTLSSARGATQGAPDTVFSQAPGRPPGSRGKRLPVTRRIRPGPCPAGRPAGPCQRHRSARRPSRRP